MSAILDISTDEPVVVYLGVPQVLYGIFLNPDGSTANLAGGTAVFFMRPILSRTPVIDGSSATIIEPVDIDGHNISYSMVSGDVAIEGDYSGWWGYVPSGGELIESPEFRIVITDRGPGYGAQTGVVVDGISQWMPTTLRALREDPDFGDRFLQQHADYVKRVIMGQVVTPDLEGGYDPALIEYLSKRTAVRLITPARDYWARQYKQVLTQGPSESATYPDMLQSLDSLHQRLCRELPGDWLQLQRMIPDLPQLRVESAPMSSLGDPSLPWNRHRTPNPQETQKPALGGPFWGSVFMP